MGLTRIHVSVSVWFSFGFELIYCSSPAITAVKHQCRKSRAEEVDDGSEGLSEFSDIQSPVTVSRLLDRLLAARIALPISPRLCPCYFPSNSDTTRILKQARQKSGPSRAFTFPRMRCTQLIFKTYLPNGYIVHCRYSA